MADPRCTSWYIQREGKVARVESSFPITYPQALYRLQCREAAPMPFSEMIEALKQGVTRDELRRSERG